MSRLEKATTPHLPPFFGVASPHIGKKLTPELEAEIRAAANEHMIVSFERPDRIVGHTMDINYSRTTYKTDADGVITEVISG